MRDIKITIQMLAALPVLMGIHVFRIVTLTMVKIDTRLDKLGDRLIAWAERIV